MKKIVLILLLLASAVYAGQVKPPRGSQLELGHPLTRGLVGYWLMNEGSGNKVSDLSGNGNTGTFYTVSLPTWTLGETGSAVQFESTDYIGIGDLTSLFSTEATLVMKLKLDLDPPFDSSRTGYAYLESAANKSHYPFTNGLLYIATFHTDRLIVGFDNSGFDKTQWHQLAITTKPGAGNYKLYQNDNLVTTGTGPANVTVAAASKLGEVTTNWLNGLIEYAFVYNRALTASEIAQLHREPFAMFAQNKGFLDGIAAGGIQQKSQSVIIAGIRVWSLRTAILCGLVLFCLKRVKRVSLMFIATLVFAGTAQALLISVEQGGTGKRGWTEKCIPFMVLSDNFGEILIGEVGQYLQVIPDWGNRGYRWDTLTTDDVLEGANLYCTLATIKDLLNNDFHNIGGPDDDRPDNDSEVPDVLTLTAGSTITDANITGGTIGMGSTPILELQVDNINIDGSTISGTDINITAADNLILESGDGAPVSIGDSGGKISIDGRDIENFNNLNFRVGATDPKINFGGGGSIYLDSNDDMQFDTDSGDFNFNNGDLENIRSINGTDVDINAGTGDLTTTGTLEAATLTEGGNAIYNSTETPGGALGGTWASPTIDDLFVKNNADDSMAGKLIITKTTQQLELEYDDSNQADFIVDAAGDLTITASGGDISFGNENLTTSGSIISTGGAQTGKFLTGGAGNTVFAFSGGNFDIRAGDGMQSSQNVLRVTSVGNFDFKAGNLITTGEINFRDTDISINSTLTDGILDMSADVAIDMFFDNADRGAGEDGQHLNINRRAAGDDYISLYVSKDRKGLIGFSGDDDLLQLTANALTVAGDLVFTSGADTDIVFKTSGNIRATIELDGDDLLFTSNIGDIRFSAGLRHDSGTFNLGSDNITTTGDITCDELTVSPGSSSYKTVARGGGAHVGFQNQSAGSAEFSLFTFEGDKLDNVFMTVYAEGTPSQTSNTSTIGLVFAQASSAYFIRAIETGTGTVYPIRIYTGTNTSQIELRTDGGVEMQTLATGTGTDLIIDAGEIKEKSSSLRFKKNIRNVNDSDKLYSLRSVYYDDKDGNNANMGGFIAEEVADIDPSLVWFEYNKIYSDPVIDETGVLNRDIVGFEKTDIPKSVNYDAILALAVKEIQNLRARIDILEKR